MEQFYGDETGFDGDLELEVASRSIQSTLKVVKIIISNENYAFAA